jgi:rhodanese-related sulfurtransferase
MLFVALRTVALVAVVSFTAWNQTANAVTPLERVKEGKAVVIDVRETAEIQKAPGMVEGALHLPTSKIKTNAPELKDLLAKISKDQIVYAYCAGGVRSGKFVEMLLKKGYKAQNLGGISDVSQAGFTLAVPK